MSKGRMDQDEIFTSKRPSTKSRNWPVFIFFAGTLVLFQFFSKSFPPLISTSQRGPANTHDILSKCMALKTVPGPPEDFHEREVSDRYEPGTKPTLIRNCTIFTGENNGTVIIHGDILLDKGIVKGIGKVSRRVIDNTPNLIVIEAHGAWVTPGLGKCISPKVIFLRVLLRNLTVDLHSHLGLLSSPLLAGQCVVVI